MVLRFLLSLLLAISVTTGLPQQFLSFKTYNVDSLLRILPNQSKTKKVNALNHLSKSLSFVDFDSSMLVADEALDLSEKLEYEEGIAAAYRNYGHNYLYLGNYPLALNNYFKALSHYEKLNNKHTLAWVNYDIAKTHYFAANYEKAIEYGYIALNIFRERSEEGKTIGGVRDTINLIGALSETYGMMWEDKKSLELDKVMNPVINKNDQFSTIERVMFAWSSGATFFSAGEIDSAKLYLHKALAYPDINKNVEAVKYRAVGWLGLVHRLTGATDSAIYYNKKALKWYDENGILLWAQMGALQLGIIYHKSDELDSADKYLMKAENLFDEMIMKNSWYRNDSLNQLVTYGLELYFPLPPIKMKKMTWNWGTSMYYWLYKNNKIRGRTTHALKYHIDYTNSLDTFNKIHRERDIVELQTRHETERSEEQIAILSKENELQELRIIQNRYLLVGLISLVILALILSIILIRQDKLKNEQQTLILQQKLFRSQMNPHFIFNSLTSIQNYIMDEEAHKASKYLSRFSKLVRHILDSSVEEYVPLEDEISTIENYLELQKIRFRGKFIYSIEVDKSINPENISIPPMLAQPFIENSIEHGIKHKDSIGNITIRFSSIKDGILFQVEDDGVGRQKALEILHKQNKDHKSLATSITYERIKILNKKYRKKIKLQITDLVNELKESQGTLVAFEIPTNYSQ